MKKIKTLIAFAMFVFIAAKCNGQTKRNYLYQIYSDTTESLVRMSTSNLKPIAVYKKQLVQIVAIKDSVPAIVRLKFNFGSFYITSAKPILINGINRHGETATGLIEYLSDVWFGKDTTGTGGLFRPVKK